MNNIKKLRESLGYSINKVAELSNVAPTYVHNLERGIKDNPTKETMLSISKALNSSVQTIFFPDDEKEVNNDKAIGK